ncbi:Ff.00g063080.m01.CDS01 [Fusarium sp. VM40]|nr:Ff.00g063080.m01.CDS01 [Fusarium sp. VM40]
MAIRSRGLPSPGCSRCRSKKIRCDEAKPICGQCAKIRSVDCKYRDEFERTWRWQTELVVKKAKAKAISTETVPIATADTKSDTQQLNPPNPTILDRFFFDWVVQSAAGSESVISLFNSLPGLYAKSSVNSLLYNSINALANAGYAQRFNSSKALTEAAEWYGESIRMLKNILSSSGGRPSNQDVMVSIILLCMYELLIDESVALEGCWVSHLGGATLLLRMQGQETTEESSAALEEEVSMVIYLQMIHNSLLTGQAPSVPVNELKLRKLPHISEHMELIYRAACLCAEWRSALFLPQSHHGWKQLSIIAGKAMSLDKQLEEWSWSLPSQLGCTAEAISVHSQPEWLQPLLTGAWTPLNTHIHPSLTVKILWRYYWQVRLILNQALLFTHSILERGDTTINPISSDLKNIKTRIVSFIDRLCESCLSTFIVDPATETRDHRTEDIPGIIGYLLMQGLPTIGLSLEQVVLVDFDLSSRKEWLAKMKKFLRDTLGVGKGAAAKEPSQYGKIPIQIWGL